MQVGLDLHGIDHGKQQAFAECLAYRLIDEVALDIAVVHYRHPACQLIYQTVHDLRKARRLPDVRVSDAMEYHRLRNQVAMGPHQLLPGLVAADTAQSERDGADAQDRVALGIETSGLDIQRDELNLAQGRIRRGPFGFIEALQGGLPGTGGHIGQIGWPVTRVVGYGWLHGLPSPVVWG